MLLERLENTNFDLACVPVFLDRPDDLDGHFAPRFDVTGFDDLSECPLAEKTNDLV